jgi:enoyl-[acyl-carrier-protein] reductase (NADH)
MRGIAEVVPILSGQKALIVGVANDRSIAWGCAEAMHTSGAEIAMTYLNDRARPKSNRWRRRSARRCFCR